MILRVCLHDQRSTAVRINFNLHDTALTLKALIVPVLQSQELAKFWVLKMVPMPGATAYHNI